MKRRIGLTVLVLTFFLAAAASASAAFPGKNGLIAAAVDKNPSAEGDSITDIWLFNKKGKVVDKLTNDAAGDFAPAFSPNGKWVVWEREADPGPAQIWKMRYDGKKKKQLTDEEDRDNGSPSFSPDGKRIVFDRDGLVESIHIWSMSKNGSGEKQLTTTGADIYDTDAIFFPSGKKILFESDRNDTLTDYDDDELITMKADGSNQQFLTMNDTYDADPDFAPDGKRIAYEGAPGILGSKLNGGGLKTLFNGVPADLETYDPVYSPDGKMLVFAGSPLDTMSDASRLYRIKANGSGLKALTPNKLGVFDASWGVKVKKKKGK